MLKVLVACGNGMGSSLIIKMKVEKVLKDMNMQFNIHHASVGKQSLMLKILTSY